MTANYNLKDSAALIEASFSPTVLQDGVCVCVCVCVCLWLCLRACG